MRARDFAKIGFFSGKGGSGESGGGGKLYHHEVKLMCYSGYTEEYSHFESLKFYSASAEPVTKYEDVPRGRLYNFPHWCSYTYYPDDPECLLSTAALVTNFFYSGGEKKYYWSLLSVENHEEIDFGISPQDLKIEDIVTEA